MLYEKNILITLNKYNMLNMIDLVNIIRDIWSRVDFENINLH